MFESLFQQLDTNLDNKLSKTEYDYLMNNILSEVKQNDSKLFFDQMVKLIFILILKNYF